VKVKVRGGRWSSTELTVTTSLCGSAPGRLHRQAVARGERVRQLLPLLRENPEATPSELARVLDTTRANISVTLSRLTKQGVVSREGKRWVVDPKVG